MRIHNRTLAVAAVAVTALGLGGPAVAFEGRITAEFTQGAQTNTLLYTVGTNLLRIAITSTNWPNPINIVERESGAVTLVFPHNRSFVRLKSPTAQWPGRPARAVDNDGQEATGETPMPLPPGIGPQPRVPDVRRGSPDSAETLTAGLPAVPNDGDLRSENVRGRETLAQQPGVAVPTPPPMPQPSGGLPPGIGPQPSSPPAFQPSSPPMPPMPMMREKLEFKATTDTTNLCGFACTRYEAKQRGETLEVWATDKLMTFQPYLRNQPHRFGPRMIEEQWPGLLQERKLFPLRVSLRYDSGTERYHFEVKSVTAEKITDPEGKLFQPPKDYHEIEPLPF